ncbi:MAG TPA: bifunctional DNA-formamidopyrimidine glycosylase/DNA-(apurinic or apyrimidinic site) lyase [Flexivirga sp.]|uniref:bifunctional DNA-formamidopyrimidine glycosylase/DNA-(apurinic or apyrimidinic site) lyase n=1 Tax=Flexivirga sp. TaxID=1962927 RepID=UPI002C742BE5|nr:bifunctional DNA-formamidopyrimidine glycosylase/DNA-(apurinic or apyrimidinic site) lyase [Flexivirga sp.]HWC23192.1 bifunctional DNA-formamidopyrimidine glycosylase/DNA-(apurinic or apyrimidinic site) lyase [Flexivirga sp.]
MPELPEVEVVRRGVATHVVGRSLTDIQLFGHRVARRHVPGPVDLADRLRGRAVTGARRRGKYLWLELDGAVEALVIHLGMSGQLLVEEPESPREKHAHALFDLSDGRQLRFVDQRTFGGLQLVALVPDPFGPGSVPDIIGHIAPDPLEAAFDQQAVSRAMRRRHTQLKRALLDQSLVSGIGNIYADEALWRARLHGERPTERLTAAAVREVLGHAADVMTEALGRGGTSFDSLYVDVNGASGYFERSLNAYGRQGDPCRRCGTPMVRESFMNRSSFSCPRCQRRPRVVG